MDVFSRTDILFIIVGRTAEQYLVVIMLRNREEKTSRTGDVNQRFQHPPTRRKHCNTQGESFRSARGVIRQENKWTRARRCGNGALCMWLVAVPMGDKVIRLVEVQERQSNQMTD